MQWTDEGLLLSVRRHGESGAIIEVLTAEHGRHAGLVRSGGGIKLGTLLQPGAQLALEWQARMEEHLGLFTAEPIRSRAAAIMADRGRLAGLNAMGSLLLSSLPEREPNPELYAGTVQLADALADADPHWPVVYARWELSLLSALGFGLDLDRCAATGLRSDLAFVSPRTGRAVSRAAGAAWADKLLALPGFMIGRGPVNMGAVREALRLTGYFLETWMLPAFGQDALPESRNRLLAVFEKHELPDLPAAVEERDDEAEWHRSMGPVRSLMIPGN